MTTDISTLQPSTAPPIPAAVLRELPVGGIYVRRWPSEINDVMRLERWTDPQNYAFRLWDGLELLAWSELFSCAHSFPPVCYPKLPGLVFSMTSQQIADRSKTVTRRRTCRLKPGDLFMAWDSSHRCGRGKARGLGVCRVVSVERVGRYHCPTCNRRLVRSPASGFRYCRSSSCVNNGVAWGTKFSDTLTPTELEREGFPGTDPDEFWGLLKKAGNVDGKGRCWRLEFEYV